MNDRKNEHILCAGCEKPVLLDDDIIRNGDAILHDRVECVAARLKKLAENPGD